MISVLFLCLFLQFSLLRKPFLLFSNQKIHTDPTRAEVENANAGT